MIRLDYLKMGWKAIDDTGPLFKNPGLREEFWLLEPKAKYLMMKLNYISVIKFGKPIIVTCIIYEGGSGIHSIKCRRGFDIRTRNYYTKEQREWLLDHVNKNFPYDKSRPRYKTLKYHKVDDKKIKDYKLKDFVPQYHLHCQVYIK